MRSYCAYHLSAQTGSCYLEFCAGKKERKLESEGSLFVEDNAFYCLDIHAAFSKAIPGFDMFDDHLVLEFTI